MAAWADAVAGDGQGRANVLSVPRWTMFVRIAQMVLAFLLLVLTAFSASKIGSGAAGFGLTWFTFILTLLYFVYLGVSFTAVPDAYHPLAHLASPFEILLNIFWLCSWAVLASEAASVGSLENFLGSSLFDTLPSDYKNALNCLKASAALGALEWVLFSITLAFLVIAFLNHHNTSGAAADVENGVGGGAEAKAATEMQNYGGAPPVAAAGGAPGAVDPATGYPVQAQQAQAPYADPNQAAYPPQGYVDPNQQAAYAQQQYQEQPVAGTAPPAQHPTA